MSDEFTSDPNEIVKEGDEVQVRVIKVDLEKNQVALSMKDPSKQRPPRQQNRGPRIDNSKKAEAYKELAANVDEKVFVPGTVSSVTDFGAFVKLEEGVEGLVHISQIKDGYLGSVADELTVGDEVKVRVQSVDAAKQKISLSMLEWKEKGENDRSDRAQRSSGPNLGFGPDFEEKASTEELAAISVGFDEAAPSWFDVALEREEMKKAKKAAGEKYLITP
jgi:predicted RNA-binding protein with RPS1 domain